MKKILVTGGGGYVGTLLIDELLNNGHQITVLDTFWFGNFLQKNKNLEIIKEDIRNLSIEKIKGHQTIIHLANIANDPTVAMDPELSWNVNVLGTHSLIDKASRAGVEHFIFGSSGSGKELQVSLRFTEREFLRIFPPTTLTKLGHNPLTQL